jgi:poly(3-hydroxybutyrate) depolymerase
VTRETNQEIPINRRISSLLYILVLAAASVSAESPGCAVNDSEIVPPIPFDVGDGNDYGGRILELTVPEQCQCDGVDCTPCPVVIGYHGYGQTGSGPASWKSRLEPKGAAAGFISLYPTGDNTVRHTYGGGLVPNWAVPSCMTPTDGCLLDANLKCDWCGNIDEDNAISLQREIDFTKAIVKWTMENHCVDPQQIFATGYSNGSLWVHTLARHPQTSGMFKAVVPMDGIDQAGNEDHLRWITAPPAGDCPWILHMNEVFDRLEPYDGMNYVDTYLGDGVPVWIYPSVLEIFAEYADKNAAYANCGFSPDDVADRFGVLAVGGVVPEGYRRLSGPGSLEGEGQEMLACFTKDAAGAICENLAICLFDGGEPGDDLTDPHSRAGQELSGGTDPGTGGVEPMDVMWRFMQSSVAAPYSQSK